MPPKRRAAASAAKAGGKRVKQEAETPKVKDAFTLAKEALLAVGSRVKVKRKVDNHCTLTWSGTVFKDYDCMLNHTNVELNTNRFYIIQVFEFYSYYYCWTRGGRVGHRGRCTLNCFETPAGAIKDFKQKFKDKTKNNWRNRKNFVTHAGQYTLIEMDGDAEVKVDSVDGKTVQACTLDQSTKCLVQLIFSNVMSKEAMGCMRVDNKKMPLGKLSKLQIAKGFEVLEELEVAMGKKSETALLEQLSSKFFTTIPHNFGLQRPPTLNSQEIVEQKKEMLMVLADIELAQTLKSETEKALDEMVETVPHPLDQDYNSLKCKLELMDKDSKMFRFIESYFKATASHYFQSRILNVWEVDRESEGERFAEHKRLKNRRLLWHGTNIAMVEAILKNGLTIMPHSGGRLGRGIYFASEHAKSVAYVSTSKNTAVMFLSEVALGNEYTIIEDNCLLKEAPTGYDSVVARGIMEPDPSEDIRITLEGKRVSVPQGKPIFQDQYFNSRFYNSEYLIYKESQCRLRYLLVLSMIRDQNWHKR